MSNTLQKRKSCEERRKYYTIQAIIRTVVLYHQLSDAIIDYPYTVLVHGRTSTEEEAETVYYTVVMSRKHYKLRRKQLTTAIISRLFGLRQNSIFLVLDEETLISESEGRFGPINDFPLWRVEISPTIVSSLFKNLVRSVIHQVMQSPPRRSLLGLGSSFYQPPTSHSAGASSSKWRPKEDTRTRKSVNRLTWQRNVEIF